MSARPAPTLTGPAGRPWQTAGEARLPEAHRMALEHLRQALEALAEAEPWAQVTAGRHIRLAMASLNPEPR